MQEGSRDLCWVEKQEPKPSWCKAASVLYLHHGRTKRALCSLPFIRAALSRVTTLVTSRRTGNRMVLRSGSPASPAGSGLWVLPSWGWPPVSAPLMPGYKSLDITSTAWNTRSFLGLGAEPWRSREGPNVYSKEGLRPAITSVITAMNNRCTQAIIINPPCDQRAAAQLIGSALVSRWKRWRRLIRSRALLSDGRSFLHKH